MDETFMREALKEAKKGFAQDEVPVGAVLVVDQSIVARGFNQVELLQDATAHAEMICLTAGAAALNQWRLLEATLYCTLEPCMMCAGAMFASRLKKLVWGAPDVRLGVNGSWVNLFTQPHPFHTIEVCSGILQNEAALLMKSFFHKQRLKHGSAPSECSHHIHIHPDTSACPPSPATLTKKSKGL